VMSACDQPGTIYRFVNTTDVVAAIEDVLGLDRMSKFDYFSRSLAYLFTENPNLAPCAAVLPQVDMEDRNPANSAAAIISDGLHFSAPGRVNAALFNAVLWFMLKGKDSSPTLQTKAPLHMLELSR
jgi:hypothetical protein